MKKTITRTALITLGITLIVAIAVFGIVSFCLPSVMMDFTASLGMKSLSGDYAFQEYERSGNIDCLVRSFVIAAEKENDRIADDRFGILYGEENSEQRDRFDVYCNGYEIDSSEAGNVNVAMRPYLLGLASRVKYRLAKTSEERRESVCEFAIGATDKSFPQGNPVVYLSVEAVGKRDGAFCKLMLEKIGDAGFERNADYDNIVKLLEGV